MKVMTLFGTRPEIIRLSQVIKHLDPFCEQILVHTGQNFDPNLSDIFFQELEIRKPDLYFEIQSASFPDQVGQILARTGAAIAKYQPDRLLILGDTNSALAGIVAARLGIPVFHMEAGNRCYDDRVPEEINRRIIDHSSNVLMPYTHRSKENLLREGIERQRIFVIGNPIYEVLSHYSEPIKNSQVLARLGIAAGNYFLATLHRAENVDDPQRLGKLIEGLSSIAETYREPMVVSLHPRTADKLKKYSLAIQSDRLKILDPFGFFDFVNLEKNARCVLSDSGTVQEECCIFRVPNVTIRDVTERAETIECGSNILSGAEPDDMLRAVKVVLQSSCDWAPPAEYLEERVSTAVTKIVLGFHWRT